LARRVGDVAQVVECLPSKHETLSLNPTNIKRKKKKKGRKKLANYKIITLSRA
jgi:hypothetical protein